MISYNHQEHKNQWKLINTNQYGERLYKLEENKMASIKESAMAFEPKTTKNIADLKSVSVELTLEDREGTNAQQEKFNYKVIVVDGEDYRVPGKVIGDLKAILERKPDLKSFSVSKKGTGMNTIYTVIPME